MVSVFCSKITRKVVRGCWKFSQLYLSVVEIIHPQVGYCIQISWMRYILQNKYKLEQLSTVNSRNFTKALLKLLLLFLFKIITTPAKRLKKIIKISSFSTKIIVTDFFQRDAPLLDNQSSSYVAVCVILVCALRQVWTSKISGHYLENHKTVIFLNPIKQQHFNLYTMQFNFVQTAYQNINYLRAVTTQRWTSICRELFIFLAN